MEQRERDSHRTTEEQEEDVAPDVPEATERIKNAKEASAAAEEKVEDIDDLIDYIEAGLMLGLGFEPHEKPTAAEVTKRAEQTVKEFEQKGGQ